MEHVSRRDAIKSTGFLAAAAALGGLSTRARAQPARPRALRIAHLTDLHIQPERKADSGVASCLRHVRSHADKPDLVLLGGDLIMDSFESDDARTKQQWDLFTRTFKDECAIPVEACLGNHDIWGWNKAKSKTNGSEAGWGKNRAMDILGLPAPYRSFDRGGWHFIVLDSVYPDGDGYIGKLDDKQWEWLEGDLKAVDPKTPILVLSHIPIVTLSALIAGREDVVKDRKVPASWMLIDAKKVINTFARHPNVKLALSGHIHEIDRIDYQGVSYLCNGAVSGNWWKGRHKQCDEGYAILDLNADGTFESTYVKYGWAAEA